MRRKTKLKPPSELLLSLSFITHDWSLFNPFLFLLSFTPEKKREGNWLVYLCFLSIEKAARAMRHETIKVAIVASSVVISGVLVACVGSIISGSICPPSPGGKLTRMYVVSDDGPYDAEPANSATMK